MYSLWWGLRRDKERRKPNALNWFFMNVLSLDARQESMPRPGGGIEKIHEWRPQKKVYFNNNCFNSQKLQLAMVPTPVSVHRWKELYFEPQSHSNSVNLKVRGYFFVSEGIDRDIDRKSRMGLLRWMAAWCVECGVFFARSSP